MPNAQQLSERGNHPSMELVVGELTQEWHSLARLFLALATALQDTQKQRLHTAMSAAIFVDRDVQSVNALHQLLVHIMEGKNPASFLSEFPEFAQVQVPLPADNEGLDFAGLLAMAANTSYQDNAELIDQRRILSLLSISASLQPNYIIDAQERPEHGVVEYAGNEVLPLHEQDIDTPLSEKVAVWRKVVGSLPQYSSRDGEIVVGRSELVQMCDGENKAITISNIAKRLKVKKITNGDLTIASMQQLRKDYAKWPPRVFVTLRDAERIIGEL